MRRFLLLTFAGLLLGAGAANAQFSRDNSVQMVRNWYRQYLGREGEPSGVNNAVEALRNGTSPEELLASILGSDEYFARAGSTPEGFVRSLYRDLAGREPTRRELDFWRARTEWESNSDVAAAMLRRFPNSWAAGGFPPDWRYVPRRPWEPRWR
jgi:hypothetical protein